jgi:hypothetical protein
MFDLVSIEVITIELLNFKQVWFICCKQNVLLNAT